MPSKIFRTNPPQELVEAFLSCAKLHGLQDSTWFTKSCINLPQLEELLPQLEPYYLPCKAKEYVHTPLTPSRGILILRHILSTCGVRLERSTSSVKGDWYQIQKASVLKQEIVMDFS